MPRIVSLIPSATEIVCTLGFEDQLVGRSHECDYPPSVEHLPVCTAPKFKPDGVSQDIDQRVKNVLREAISVYDVHSDVLKVLHPDVIITQSQCEVCAVSLKDVERACDEWLDTDAQVVSLEPNDLNDILSDIERVANALGIPEHGQQYVQALRQCMSAIVEQTRQLPTRPTVACIEWIDPLMAAGNWMPELVEMAGGVDLFGEVGKLAAWITWDDLRAKAPDVIILLPCGFDIARVRQDIPILESKPGWELLKAVQNGHIYVTDGNQYFNRPGPRLLESLEILVEIIHPETFHFGHEGTGWQPL